VPTLKCQRYNRTGAPSCLDCCVDPIGHATESSPALIERDLPAFQFALPAASILGVAQQESKLTSPASFMINLRLWLAPLCLALLVSCDSGNSPVQQPTISSSEGTPPPAADQPETPTQTTNNPNASFAIASNGQSYVLREGDDAISIPVVLTRKQDHSASISLSVQPQTPDDADDLEYSIEDTSLPAGQSTTQLNIQLRIGNAPLLAHTRELIISASDGQETSSAALQFRVEPVEAPDVYLLIGQSNMEGYSELGAKEVGPGGLDASNPRILQLNVTANDEQNFAKASDFTDPLKNVAFPRFVEAQDPLHQSFEPGKTGKSGERIGLGLTFAKSALRDTTQDIVLVPAAWAGTGFCKNEQGDLAWNPTATVDPNFGGSDLYDRALTRVDLVLSETNGILRGILWHQGESDATSIQCARAYEANMEMLINSLRTEILEDARGPIARGIDSDVPFVLGTMSRGGEYADYDEPKTLVDTVHRTLATTIPHTRLSNHDDLVPPAYQCGQGLCIHFGAEAYREMGRRYYQSLLDAIGS